MFELRICPQFIPAGKTESITIFNDHGVAREAAYDAARGFRGAGRKSYAIALFKNGRFAGLSITRRQADLKFEI